VTPSIVPLMSQSGSLVVSQLSRHTRIELPPGTPMSCAASFQPMSMSLPATAE
jgi:hypothetical protein